MEYRLIWGSLGGGASQIIRELIWSSQRSHDVCSSLALVKTPRKLLHIVKGYLVTAAIAHEVLYPFLPDIKSRMVNFRRALRVATGGIWWRCLTLKYSSSFIDSIADHRSLSIPEDIAHIDTITHLFKVLVRMLSMLCRQERFGPLSIRPELTDGWGAREDDTEPYLKHVEVVRRNQVPYQLSVIDSASNDLTRITGRVLGEVLSSGGGCPTNAQRCSDKAKTKKSVQLPFGPLSHLYVP